MKTAIAAAVAVLILAGGVAAADRDEMVLAWDDEENPRTIYSVPAEGRQIAVMFQAPEGFDWLNQIRCYVGNDNQGGATQPFTLTVWAPADAGDHVIPGQVIYEYTSGGGYPEELWIQFNAPDYVHVGDSETFPGRVFFVGVQWMTSAPALGVDWDPIVSGKTWQRFASDDWALYPETGNCACVRAVVTDEEDTSVELRSWGVVKSSYRTP
ncbi:MAG: hypothetical protein JXB46_08865 [Candidatus Eisenbacteria bacterium]|nr:hypothetical protein [Candidatus Eisenbacteria bacterium]